MSYEGFVLDVEEWRDYPEFPDRYMVSNHGNVLSKSFLKTSSNSGGVYTFWTKSAPLALLVNHDGYPQVRIQVNGVKYTRKVHRMVAQTFIENPDNLPCVNHKNSNRADNKVENLEWCTNAENVRHGYAHGLNSNKGELHPVSVLNDEIVLTIKRMHRAGMSCKEIVTHLANFKYQTVYKVIARKNWKHVEPE